MVIIKTYYATLIGNPHWESSASNVDNIGRFYAVLYDHLQKDRHGGERPCGKIIWFGRYIMDGCRRREELAPFLGVEIDGWKARIEPAWIDDSTLSSGKLSMPDGTQMIIHMRVGEDRRRTVPRVIHARITTGLPLAESIEVAEIGDIDAHFQLSDRLFAKL